MSTTTAQTRQRDGQDRRRSPRSPRPGHASRRRRSRCGGSRPCRHPARRSSTSRISGATDADEPGRGRHDPASRPVEPSGREREHERRERDEGEVRERLPRRVKTASLFASGRRRSEPEVADGGEVEAGPVLGTEVSATRPLSDEREPGGDRQRRPRGPCAARGRSSEISSDADGLGERDARNERDARRYAPAQSSSGPDSVAGQLALRDEAARAARGDQVRRSRPRRGSRRARPTARRRSARRARRRPSKPSSRGAGRRAGRHRGGALRPARAPRLRHAPRRRRRSPRPRAARGRWRGSSGGRRRSGPCASSPESSQSATRRGHTANRTRTGRAGTTARRAGRPAARCRTTRGPGPGTGASSLEPRPAAALLAEAGRDHGDADLVAAALVDHGAEDHVRVRVGGARDDLGGLVHLEEAEIGRAGDVEQDARRALDRRLEQRRADGGARGLGGAALALRRRRSPSAPSRRRA